MKNTESTDIRFKLPGEADAAYSEFQKLAIITGKGEPRLFAELIQRHVDQKPSQEILKSATWVTQNELIEILQRDYSITTNTQTLYNWRNEGLLTGLFGSDGGKGLLYNLEKMAEKYQQIKDRPRASRNQPATIGE